MSSAENAVSDENAVSTKEIQEALRKSPSFDGPKKTLHTLIISLLSSLDVGTNDQPMFAGMMLGILQLFDKAMTCPTHASVASLDNLILSKGGLSRYVGHTEEYDQVSCLWRSLVFLLQEEVLDQQGTGCDPVNMWSIPPDVAVKPVAVKPEAAAPVPTSDAETQVSDAETQVSDAETQVSVTETQVSVTETQVSVTETDLTYAAATATEAEDEAEADALLSEACSPPNESSEEWEDVSPRGRGPPPRPEREPKPPYTSLTSKGPCVQLVTNTVFTKEDLARVLRPFCENNPRLSAVVNWIEDQPENSLTAGILAYVKKIDFDFTKYKTAEMTLEGFVEVMTVWSGNHYAQIDPLDDILGFFGYETGTNGQLDTRLFVFNQVNTLTPEMALELGLLVPKETGAD